jgi:hypothetical protein
MRTKVRAALTLAASATIGVGLALASAVPASAAETTTVYIYGSTTLAPGDSASVRHALNYTNVQDPVTVTRVTNSITAPAGITFAGPATIQSGQDGGPQSCTLVNSQRIDCTWTGTHTWGVGDGQTADWITSTYDVVVGADTAPGTYWITYGGEITHNSGVTTIPADMGGREIRVVETVDTPVFPAGAAVGGAVVAGVAGIGGLIAHRRRASATASATDES